MKTLRLVAFCSGTALLAACGASGMNPAIGNSASHGTAQRAAAAAQAAASGYKQLYAFKGTPDGASPYSGFAASGNTLYATTLNGSTNYCSQSCSNYCYLGCGTIFSVDSSGNEHVIYDFRGNFSSAHDGSWPFAGLTPLNGQFFGVASSAGATAHGAVYTVSTSGQEKIIYNFLGGTDAEAAEAPLVAYKNLLFGTSTIGGGSGCGGNGCGTVYRSDTSGKESVLYSFKGGNDGYRIFAPVTVLHGALYGAALQGGGTGCGGSGCGLIFKLGLKGKERVLYRFGGTSDGAFPNGLTVVNGALYGTTEGGGTRNSGTFFSITPAGTLMTLYNFQDIPDGNLPGASLIYYKGSFYGTTVGGGTAGIGTVFKIGKTGSEKVLYSFQGGSDGSDPQGPVYAFKRQLYGTTTQGGGTGCGGNGCGTIYRVKP
jgi:uncharacterized repeat protein (TIGR03803 family)